MHILLMNPFVLMAMGAYGMHERNERMRRDREDDERKSLTQPKRRDIAVSGKQRYPKAPSRK